MAMEATRVTVDEVKERMERGEQFAFVDTRNPQAWGEADTKLPGAFGQARLLKLLNAHAVLARRTAAQLRRAERNRCSADVCSLRDSGFDRERSLVRRGLLLVSIRLGLGVGH